MKQLVTMGYSQHEHMGSPRADIKHRQVMNATNFLENREIFQVHCNSDKSAFPVLVNLILLNFLQLPGMSFFLFF